MIVIDIESIDKKRSKVLVDLDFAFPLYKVELLKFNIKINEELNNYKTDILPLLKKRAVERAYQILKISDKTEFEVIKKLKDSYYPNHIIKFVILYLRKKRFLDDKTYIINYIDTHSETKSLYNIKQSLLKKGIKRDLLEEIIDINDIEIDELAQIRDIVSKYNLNEVLKDRRETNRLVQKLLRRSYKYEYIKQVLFEE